MNNPTKSSPLPKDVLAHRGGLLSNRPQSEQSRTGNRGTRAPEELKPQIQPSSQSLLSAREKNTDTRLLTLKEAADRLAISLPTIRSWVWQRKIEIVKIGRCVRIREQVISELIFRNTIPPRTKA